MSELIRETPCGKVVGTTCQWSGVESYKGIRYATAGRWEYPKVVETWDGIYDATSYGDACYQPRAFYNEAENPGKQFYYNEFRKGETYHYSEDCLFLNIFVPEGTEAGANLPVLFYIHGGGYTGGCGYEMHFDAPVWPKHGVIGVTINYRLGPMGFVCLRELEEEAGHSGNYGLYDQVAALQWIQRNISAFGGDPKQVTVMGQSAGAMSVQILCCSPLTDGLFHRAVMSSGGGVGKIFSVNKTTEERFAFWEQVMKKAKCSSLKEFRDVSPNILFAAWEQVKKENKNSGMVASPCLDGTLLPESQIKVCKQGKQTNISYMIGSNSEDIVPPLLYSMAKKWCLLQETQKKQETYLYHFEHQLPGDDNGAWHSSDLWYWFGTYGNSWRPMTELDEQLSRQMVSYLMNFVKTGNPNGTDLPQWNPMLKDNPCIMTFSEEARPVKKISMGKLVKAMVTNKAVGE